MGSTYRRDDAMATRVGEAVPHDVRRALQNIAQGAEKIRADDSVRERRLPGMLLLEPEKLATMAARMNRQRVEQAKTTLSNALEIAVSDHGDSLSSDEILQIAKRADALLDVLLARQRELEELEESERQADKILSRQEERQRARKKKKTAKQKSAHTPHERPKARRSKKGAPGYQPSRQPAAPPSKSPRSISRLYASLDHLKLQALHMDSAQRESLRRSVLAELETHRLKSHLLVRPDPSLEIKARAVLAVINGNRTSTARSWKPPPEAPAPIKPRQAIYRGSGHVVSGGLPGLGRR